MTVPSVSPNMITTDIETRIVRTDWRQRDMRFDVPAIGLETIRIAAEARLRVIAIEAGKTLLLERDAIVDLASSSKISIVAR